MKRCVFALGTITYAMKAKQALSMAGVFVQIIKLDAKLTKRGCAYGAEVDGADAAYAAQVLKDARIPYSEKLTLPRTRRGM